MRHNVKTKTLNRTSAHRNALLKNLSESLIIHGKIETTIDKAKYVRPYVEKLITKAKNAQGTDKVTLFNAVKYLKTKLITNTVIEKLLTEIAPKFSKTNGGYTRIVRTGNRDGDNAVKARIEIIETKTSKKVSEKDKLVAKAKGKKVKVEETTNE
jgi:large subunit ribosomal protein L17